MSISDEVEKLLASNKEKFEENIELKKMQDILKEMQNLGLAAKQGYTIPPLDTLGKKLFESYKSSICSEEHA